MNKNETKAIVLKGLEPYEAIQKFASFFTDKQKNAGIILSIIIAQFILESGFGQSELIQNANNCFGLKVNMSGNTWDGSTWDGKSIYKKYSKEFINNKEIVEFSNFRQYECLSDCIDDYIAYLLGAKNGENLRYDNIKYCKDYVKVANILINGGYATGKNYVNSIINIIDKWDLTKFDK